MKKKTIVGIFALLICFVLVGCNKKEETKNEDWQVNIYNPGIMFDEETKYVFDNATKDYTEAKLELVAELGTQVVAGTNYMFLAIAETNGTKSYKVVNIYYDLEGNAKINSVSDFDATNYVNKNVELNTELLSGGWQTVIPGKAIVLEDKVQTYFNKATEQLVGISYYPITVLAKQNKEGTNYAILSYGQLSDQNASTGLFVITMHIDENEKSEIVSSAAVELKDFSK